MTEPERENLCDGCYQHHVTFEYAEYVEAELASLQEKVARLRIALAFYAESDRDDDNGHLAREALRKV